jgi:hypothetical protein
VVDKAGAHGIIEDIVSSVAKIFHFSQCPIMEPRLPHRARALSHQVDLARRPALELSYQLTERNVATQFKKPVQMIRHDNKCDRFRFTPCVCPKYFFDNDARQGPIGEYRSPPVTAGGDQVDLTGLRVATFAKVATVR